MSKTATVTKAEGTALKDIEIIKDLAGGNYKVLHRVDFRGQRIYVQPEPFRHFSGLTGALSACTFKGDMQDKVLRGWRDRMIDQFGKQNMTDFVEMTADFGTLLHMALMTIKEQGQLDWQQEYDNAVTYFQQSFRQQGRDADGRLLESMAFEYQQHAAALMQFVYDKVMLIHAIEVPAIWDEFNIATPIDLVCTIKDKGMAVINIKTSSQINPKHLEQVACEWEMWNQTYTEQEATYSAILRTKNWRKSPTYELKINDNPGELVKRVEHRLDACRNSGINYLPNPTYKRFVGVTEIGQQPEIEEVTLEQLFTSQLETAKL